jgi:hypothetical protein
MKITIKIKRNRLWNPPVLGDGVCEREARNALKQMKNK